MEDLGGLPTEAQPSRDLWPQIAWRMEGDRTQDPSRGQMMLFRCRFPSRRSVVRGRRVSLPAWQFWLPALP